MGVLSLLSDLIGTVGRFGDVSSLRGKGNLSAVRPLVLGFRDGESLSKIEVSAPANSKLAGSGGVFNSTKVPVGIGVDCCGFMRGLVSCWLKIEVFMVEPPSPNKIDASEGSPGSMVVADGSSRSRPEIWKSDRSVGGSSKSRVSLRLGKGEGFSPNTI